ncbi:hypothetical protein FH972_023943 [Carpinus fangiana]|uniref:SURP motif domain-containing protein n=1 Tax=Carpinus fangiana TaxID=176857 RepID=A0A5N6KZ38_9ROSI|nr:hypothetical protein FH972_023943 [Carpinus fangiana]
MATAEDATGKPPPDVVLPPTSMRTVVETTAKYIVRNGMAFEEKIRKNGNPKLAFINENDPYHSFYVWRIGEIRAGRGIDGDGKPQGGVAVPIPEAPKGPPAPAEFHFSARMPNISAQDFEVVKLTALYVAKRGRSFMTTLSQREANNYQFDFLRPQHSLHQFFSRLIDQYAELLNAHGSAADASKAEEARIAELTKNVKNRLHILDRAKQRGEYVKFQGQQKAKKEEKREKEALEYAQIDWHDFVVVENIVFTPADDEVELPRPTSLNNLQTASLEQRGAMSLQPHNMRIEEAVPFEDVYYNTNFQQPPPQPAPVPVAMPVVPPPVVQETPEEILIRERAANREAAQAATRPAAGGPMKIRSDYVPRAKQRRQQPTQVICPNCKQSIPADQFEEHIRIELLDPRWQQQRARAEGRAAITNLNTSDVVNNLKRLASQRSDVFDSATGKPLTPEEADRRKKQTLGTAQMPPGMSAPQGPTNIQDQLAYIRDKAKGGQ